MNQNKLQTAMPSRAVLENVPRVGFYEGGERCPEDIILPSCMRSALEYLGESDFGCKHCAGVSAGCKIACSYSYFVGVTGAAFFLSWKKGWYDDNCALMYMSEDPTTPDRRAFRAAGYTCDIFDKEENQDSEALFRQCIRQSIQEEKPILGYGIIGPPETCLITGYDEDGDVLIGWNFFQHFQTENSGVEFEPNGYFRKRNWYPQTERLVVFGEKQAKPALAEIYRDALVWGLELLRAPSIAAGPDAPEAYRERANGLAAYDAWAEHILMDEAFPAGDEATLRQRHDVHNMMVGMVAEERWYGSQFLIGAIDHLPYQPVEDLLHAAACFAAEHDLMWKAWDLVGGNGYPQAWQKLAEPEIRRQMVPIIQQSRDQAARAAGHIERALARLV